MATSLDLDYRPDGLFIVTDDFPSHDVARMCGTERKDSTEQMALLFKGAPAMREALQRIAHAKPDRLDHSIDVGIIERAAAIARAALAKVGEQS